MRCPDRKSPLESLDPVYQEGGEGKIPDRPSMQGRGSSLQRGVCHLRREQENGDIIELLTQQKLDDSERSLVKSSKLKNKLRKGLEMLLSGRKYHNSISKVR